MSDPATDPYQSLQYNMVHGTRRIIENIRMFLILTKTSISSAHAALKVGYNNIIQHLEEPSKFKNDTVNFLGYCSAWAESLVAHHDAEGKSTR